MTYIYKLLGTNCFTMWLFLLMFMAITNSFAIFVGKYYHRRDGILLLNQDGSTPDCAMVDTPPDPLRCALMCSLEPTCLSFSHKREDNCCVLNTEELYDFNVRFQEDAAWAYYGPSRTDVRTGDWTLVFKAVSGSGGDLWKTWTGDIESHDLPTLHPGYYSVYSTSATYPFYRSDWLDKWPAGGVAQVRVGFFTSGTEVAFLEFDGTGSSRDDWFSHSRLTASTWNDLELTSPAMFSASGQLFRKFYSAMFSQFSNCDNLGWTIVLNRQGNTCDFDKETPTPQFIYSTEAGATYFKYLLYGKAEVFAVFVKFQSPVP